jgi:hypothetical protein
VTLCRASRPLHSLKVEPALEYFQIEVGEIVLKPGPFVAHECYVIGSCDGYGHQKLLVTGQMSGRGSKRRIRRFLPVYSFSVLYLVLLSPLLAPRRRKGDVKVKEEISGLFFSSIEHRWVLYIPVLS